MCQDGQAEAERQQQEGVWGREIRYPAEGIVIGGADGVDGRAEKEHHEDLEPGGQEIDHRGDAVFLSQGVGGPQESLGVLVELLPELGNFSFQPFSPGLVSLCLKAQRQESDAEQEDTDEYGNREMPEDTSKPFDGMAKGRAERA